MFGITDAPIVRFKLNRSDPWTDRISSQLCEKLLKMTHDAIRKHLGKENWRNKLSNFSGPQFHKDRGKGLFEYNPDIRTKTGVKVHN